MALAIRETGERFWEGEALALDLGESGLWETGDSSGRYGCGRELVCKGDEAIGVELDSRGAAASTTDQVAPDLLGGQPVEWRVIQSHVDTGFEGFIERADSVGGQEAVPPLAVVL